MTRRIKTLIRLIYDTLSQPDSTEDQGETGVVVKAYPEGRPLYFADVLLSDASLNIMAKSISVIGCVGS